MAGRFSIDGIFTAVDRFTRPVRRMQDRMRRFARAGGDSMRSMNRAADGVIRGFARIGVAAAAAGAAMALMGADVVRTGADFEQALTSAATRMGGTVTRGTEAFSAMEEAARRVGAETEFTATAASEGLGFLAMAGFDAERAIAALPGVVNLATASGLDLARATDIITDSMGPLGLATRDAAQAQINLARVSDVLATTASSTNTNVEQMFEAIVAGGNMSTAAGQSVETFAALVGSMANDGIKGEQAGTALRNMFMRLQAPTSRAAGLLESFGVSIADEQGNMRDMTAVMADLSAGMEDMGNVARNAALTEIFGARAVGPALSIINQGADSIRGLRATLEGAAGATDRMATQMRDTTGGDMRSFMSMVESIKLAIFDVVRGPLREVIQSLVAWGRANREVIASGISEFMAYVSDNLDTIVQRAQGLAVVVGGWLAVAVAIKAVAAAQAIFNLVAAANPYVLLVMGIVAAVGLLVAYWPEISAFFSALGEKAGEVAGAIGEWFSGAWDSIVSGVTSAFDWVVGVVTGWIDFLWGIHQTVLEIGVGLAMVLLGPLMPAFEFLGEVARKVIDAISAYFSFLWEGIKTGASIVGGWLSAVWQRVSAAASAVAGAVARYFSAMWDGLVAGATWAYGMFESVWGAISGFFSGIWGGIVAGFNEHIQPIIDAISGIIGNLRTIGAATLGTDGGSSDGSTGAGASPQIVTPQERTAAAVSETRSTTTNTSTVTIQDQTGRARMRGRAPGITFQRSGAPG